MLPAPLVNALAAGALALVSILAAWKLRRKSDPIAKRNLVIIIDGQALLTRLS